ncbi:MAG: cupin domain-containing protein [Leptolyngbyaceae bacterium]|nr:cupin domain-containing protein [Leptolyngbyaceae bacterium]
MMINSLSIMSTFVVMDGDGSAIPIPVSDTFFKDLEHQFGDFKGKHLISHFAFDEDWDSWEMHPAGDELVYLLSGQVDVVLEHDAEDTKVPMKTPGEFAIVPKGVWHTIKVRTPSSMLFITPGAGTQHRPI